MKYKISLTSSWIKLFLYDLGFQTSTRILMILMTVMNHQEILDLFVQVALAIRGFSIRGFHYL